MKRLLKSCLVGCLVLAITNHSFAEKAARRTTDSTVSQAIPSLLRLKMRKDSTNTDEIVIRCDNKASSKMVYGEDAFDMGGIGAEVSLSAYSSDNVPLAIDVLPFPGLQADVIALLVGAKSSGTYQLASTQLSGLAPGYDAWLKDSFTGDSLKLALNATYTFNIDKDNPATFGKKRFVVTICQNPESAYSLANFTASQASVGRPVQLGWTMNNEHPNTNYTVERSIDTGRTFVSLASLPGTGAGDYYLSDNNPVAGQNYYHLKVVDSTNTVSYSQLVEIENKSGAGAIVVNPINIYPNPVSNLVNVSITEKKPVLAGYDITITNSSGMVVKKSSASQSDWQSGVDTLKPGIYLIQVTNNNDHSFVGKSKFVKL
jgi:hypothetical protein